MTHIGGAVLVRRAAAHAPFRVGCVLELRPRMSRIVEAEHDRAIPLAGELADLWIVPVHDKPRDRSELPHGAAPPFGDELELSVAIELVAEEVSQAQHPWLHTAHNLWQSSLVDLEEAQLGPSGGEQGGGDARDEIRTRSVVREAGPSTQGLRRHRGGRCLAVRRGDERGAEREASREGVDRVGIELPEELAGHCCASSRTRKTREASGHLSSEDLNRKTQAHLRKVPPPELEGLPLPWTVSLGRVIFQPSSPRRGTSRAATPPTFGEVMWG